SGTPCSRTSASACPATTPTARRGARCTATRRSSTSRRACSRTRSSTTAPTATRWSARRPSGGTRWPGPWWRSSPGSSSSGGPRRGTAVADPMVVVDNLHVVYRVYGSGADKGTAATALLRMVKRQQRPSIREVHAIRGMSFVAYKGDAVGVIGRNGSGKSTLLRAIAGLLPAEEGMVYTFGHAALLGVNAALMENLTGEKNVMLGCLAMGMSPQTVKERYQSIVDFSGVGDFINLAMKTYSTGMESRLRLAIASAKNQDILLVDEALATGDAEFRVTSHQRMDELREHAGAVCLVAHTLNEIEETCNKVIWLEKGLIVQAGENVTEIIDAYLAATGGEPRVREPR